MTRCNNSCALVNNTYDTYQWISIHVRWCCTIHHSTCVGFSALLRRLARKLTANSHEWSQKLHSLETINQERAFCNAHTLFSSKYRCCSISVGITLAAIRLRLIEIAAILKCNILETIQDRQSLPFKIALKWFHRSRHVLWWAFMSHVRCREKFQ